MARKKQNARGRGALGWVLCAGLLEACSGRPDLPPSINPNTDVRRVDAVDAVVCSQDVVFDAGLTGVYDDAETRPLGCGQCSEVPCTTTPLGCGPTELCDDGLDNDCNGAVDEGCACSPGLTQACFVGPPGRRGRGVCADGVQTCQGQGELGEWSACVGGITPTAERCDGADNNCDGCVDNGLCCRAEGSCPAGVDPRVPEAPPFRDYVLHARDFFTGVAAGYSWRVVGGPCDQLLFASSGYVTYTVLHPDPTDLLVTHDESLVLQPTLSGDYTVTLTVYHTDGTSFECTFLVRIRAPGVRAELCWDRTGETDIDLWLHRPGDTNAWLSSGNTCFYGNCRNASALSWGYAPTPGRDCREPSGAGCNNPRLDIDNIRSEGVPENINIDNPRDGEQFRVAVNYFSGTGAVLPMVNLYCGGVLRATYGGVDYGAYRIGSQPIEDFNVSGQDSSGSLWRVADVTMTPDGQCTIAPLVQNTTQGPCVDTSTDRSFSGNCHPR